TGGHASVRIELRTDGIQEGNEWLPQGAGAEGTSDAAVLGRRTRRYEPRFSLEPSSGWNCRVRSSAFGRSSMSDCLRLIDILDFISAHPREREDEGKEKDPAW